MYQDSIDFVRNTSDDPEGFIILHDPLFIGNERKYIMDAMDSNFVSSVGELEAFLKANTRKDADGRCYNAKIGRLMAAVVPMHTFGHPCLIEDIADISTCFNIPSTVIIPNYYENVKAGKYR